MDDYVCLKWLRNWIATAYDMKHDLWSISCMWGISLAEEIGNIGCVKFINSVQWMIHWYKDRQNFYQGIKVQDDSVHNDEQSGWLPLQVRTWRSGV